MLNFFITICGCASAEAPFLVQNGLDDSLLGTAAFFHCTLEMLLGTCMLHDGNTNNIKHVWLKHSHKIRPPCLSIHQQKWR